MSIVMSKARSRRWTDVLKGPSNSTLTAWITPILTGNMTANPSPSAPDLVRRPLCLMPPQLLQLAERLYSQPEWPSEKLPCGIKCKSYKLDPLDLDVAACNQHQPHEEGCLGAVAGSESAAGHCWLWACSKSAAVYTLSTMLARA